MNVILIILSLLILGIFLRPKYHEPRVYRGFVPHEVCDYIMKQGNERLRPSTISKVRVVDESIRKSETAWLGTEDDTVKNVLESCVSVTDRPLRNCEQLQVLKYTPGGFYNPHQDAFKCEKNMRRHTCIIALNDNYEGGETVFPNLDKEYKLNKGDMLFFDTMDDWGMMTPKALHGGNPVTSGEKWICNLWIRTHPYPNV